MKNPSGVIKNTHLLQITGFNKHPGGERIGRTDNVSREVRVMLPGGIVPRKRAYLLTESLRWCYRSSSHG